MPIRSTNVGFLGTPWPARFSLIAANIWRGIPFVAISLLAGLQTISPSLYEAAMLDGATAWLAQESMKNPDEAGAGATDYLHLFGYTALAYLWARMAKIALEKRQGKTDVAFYETKLATARFYMQRMLPRSGAHFASLMAGSKTLMEFPDDAF